jgi:hypothetical protein
MTEVELAMELRFLRITGVQEFVHHPGLNKTRIQCFRNLICFLSQVKGGSHLLCRKYYKYLTSVAAEHTVRVRVTLQLTVGQSVCLGVPIWGS